MEIWEIRSKHFVRLPRLRPSSLQYCVKVKRANFNEFRHISKECGEILQNFEPSEFLAKFQQNFDATIVLTLLKFRSKVQNYL